jgi:pyruvate kinase
MTTTETRTAAKRAAEVHAEMTALRKAILEGARLTPEGGDDPAIVNLSHYLALRHHDIRPLQRRLMALGLSSMGRLESRVLPTIDAVLFALSKIASDAVPAEAAILPEQDFFAGEAQLETACQALFGKQPDARRTRIMVTLKRPTARISFWTLLVPAWTSHASTVPMTVRTRGRK